MDKEQELMQLTNRYRELHARVAADNKEMDAINILARKLVQELLRDPYGSNCGADLCNLSSTAEPGNER